MNELLLRRLRSLGMRRFDCCRLTRNRNVMVSFSAERLRVHEGYVDAPDDILAAIVLFVEGRTRAERLGARRRLLSYPIAVAKRPRRRDATHPDDRRMAEQLAAWHAHYNATLFSGELRSVTVRVSRRMRARLGHYSGATDAGTAEIAISRRHLRRHGWKAALETLVHEMVHQWQDERGLPIDHGRIFRHKAREVGIEPYARRRMVA